MRKNDRHTTRIILTATALITALILFTACSRTADTSGTPDNSKNGKSKQTTKTERASESAAEPSEDPSTKESASKTAKELLTPIKSSAKTKKKTVKKKLVAIDAGHQTHANLKKEQMDPDKKTKKIKVTGGTQGVATRVPEYKLNLAVAKKLQKELKARGYNVYMVRAKNNVNLSNKTRARRVNKKKADIYIRLHANAATSSAVHGACALYKPSTNSYVTVKVVKKNKKLSRLLLNAMCKKTGARKEGLFKRDDLTGSNWSKVPTTLIEMGYMTNRAEDKKMQKKSYQKKIAVGIANGVDQYFGK